MGHGWRLHNHQTPKIYRSVVTVVNFLEWGVILVICWGCTQNNKMLLKATSSWYGRTSLGLTAGESSYSVLRTMGKPATGGVTETRSREDFDHRNFLLDKT